MCRRWTACWVTSKENERNDDVDHEVLLFLWTHIDTQSNQRISDAERSWCLIQLKLINA